MTRGTYVRSAGPRAAKLGEGETKRMATQLVKRFTPRAVKLSEADLKLTCTELLQWDGWRCLYCETVYDGRRGRGFGEVGMPDSLYIRYYDSVNPALSETLWIEWKSPRGVVKPHQARWHDLERARGAFTKMAGVDFPATIEGFRAWYKTSGLLRRSI